MARPSKLSDAQWEELRARVNAGEVMARVSREYGISKSAASEKLRSDYIKQNPIKKSKKASLESEIADTFELALKAKASGKLYGLPEVKSYIKEYSVKHGRADFAVFHCGKNISIVEVKGSYLLRDIVAGIGQLHLYEVAFCEKWDGYKVDKILIASCLDDQEVIIGATCKSAGVRFIRHVEA